jgi:hypothetical protein
METKKIEVTDAIHIEVNCIQNDWDDIKIGGPSVLGYDFYVSSDEEKTIDFFIEKCIKKYDRPLIDIHHNVEKDFSVEKLWTNDMIDECIKENEIW